MLEDRFLKRLRKKARKGVWGWPIATIAFYGPDLSRATKIAVGIVPSEDAAVQELRDWKGEHEKLWGRTKRDLSCKAQMPGWTAALSIYRDGTGRSRSRC
jgi:hypothetical protein